MVIESAVISYEPPSNPMQSPFNTPRNLHVDPYPLAGTTAHLLRYTLI